MRDFSVFKGRKNYIQSGEAVLHLGWMPAVATGRLLKERIGIGYDSIISKYEDDFFYWYYDHGDLKKLTEFVIDNQGNNPRYIRNLINLWKKDLRAFQRECKKLDKINLARLGDNELISVYGEFISIYCREWSIPIIADAISLHSESLARHGLLVLLKKQGKEEEFFKFFPILTSPVNVSFANSEKREMLKIALKIRKSSLIGKIKKSGPKQSKKLLMDDPYSRNQLANHSRKYHWIRNSYLIARNLKPADFAPELVEFSKEGKDPAAEIRGMDANLNNMKREKVKLMHSLGIGGKLALIFDIIERFAWWQDERKKQNLIGDHYVCRLLNEFAKRLHATYFDLAYTTPSELIDCFKRKQLDGKLVKERRRYSIMVIGKGRDGIYVGKDAAELEKILLQGEKTVFDEVRGQCASIGRAEGHVRIVNTSKDISKMKPGDILVSGMTRPELVPAMKKAAAIVTDEGGITSHAAIISRELGIPCIIGTKYATKMLKDGDFVEVNANHGVVRKVE
ncbi:MAG: PEP-utilizing enzyme [Candidatus Micrarchaeota archaeon]